jgi:hypothetical protein
MATVFLGTTLGPITASFILKQTDSINNVLYMAFALFLLFELYVLLVLPESHDYKNHKMPKEAENQTFLQRINIFSALTILYRANSKHANRYALAILAGVQFFINMLALPPTLLYAMLKFGWTAYEGGLYISLSSCMRFLQMVLVLPLLSKLFHKSKASSNTDNKEAGAQVVMEPPSQVSSSSMETLSELVTEERSEQDIKHSILFDSWMLRTGCAFDTASFVVCALVTTSSGFAANTVLHSFAMLAIPSIRSLTTTLVNPSQVGEMLGAMAVLEAVSSKSTQGITWRN